MLIVISSLHTQVKLISFFNVFVSSYKSKKTLPSLTVIIRGLCLLYKSNIKYIFCNKPLKTFLNGKMSKVKPTSLLAIKKLLM